MSGKLIPYLSMGVSLVPIVIGIFSWKREPKELRILTSYLSIGFIIGIIMAQLAARGTNNLWLMHIFTPIQLGFLLWMFSSWTDKTINRWFLILIPLFIVFWATMLLFFESFTQFNTYTRPLEALILIAVSAYILFVTNKQEDTRSMFRLPRFWIASGTLVYFSGMILIYALSNLLLANSPDLLKVVWTTIQTTSNILTSLMYIAGFLCLSPRFHPQT